MTPRAVRSFSWLSFGALIGAAAGFAIQVGWARLLSVEQLGNWAAAWTALMLAAKIASWGIGPYWLNLYAFEGHNAERWLASSFKVVAIGCFFTATLWWGWWYFQGIFHWPVLTLLMLSLPAQVTLELTASRLQLQEQFRSLALWQLFPHFLRLAWVAVLIIAGFGSPYYLSLGYGGIAVLLIAAGGRLFAASFPLAIPSPGNGSARQAISPARQASLRTLFRQSTPFALGGIFYLFYFQGGVLLLHALASEQAAAQFQVALVVLSGIYLLPAVIYQKLMLPRMHRWAYQDTHKLATHYRYGHIRMFWLGGFLMVGVWLVAPWCVPLLFGEEYHQSAGLLAILALGIPWRFAASSSGAVLTTRHWMMLKIKLLATAATAYLLLALLLIPWLGSSGAAWALTLGDILLWGLHHIAVRRCLASLPRH